MFDLPADVLRKIKEQNLYKYLEATASNATLAGLAASDDELAKMGAFQFTAVLWWFELNGITDPAEMRRKLEEALRNA